MGGALGLPNPFQVQSTQEYKSLLCVRTCIILHALIWVPSINEWLHVHAYTVLLGVPLLLGVPFRWIKVKLYGTVAQIAVASALEDENTV